MRRADRISDSAYDALRAIYERDRHVFSACHAVGGLRKLVRAHGINPDL